MHYLEEIEGMLNEVVEDGHIPYMLITPHEIAAHVRWEFPHILVVATDGDELLCVQAEPHNFKNGALVLH